MVDISRRRFMAALGGAGFGSLAQGGPAAAQATGTGRIDGSRLGLVPGDGRDQSIVLAKALARAAREKATLVLPAGTYLVREVAVKGPVRIAGVTGATRLVCSGGDFLLLVQGGLLELEGLAFNGAGAFAAGEFDGLVRAKGCDARIRDCAFTGGAGSGLLLENCSGVVENNRFSGHGRAGVFSHGGRNMRIIGNHVSDCGDNGIMVWQPRKGPDGAVVAQNVISRIRADRGGDGPYGNGVSIFRAGGVKVVDNTIRDCAFSAVRNNSGDGCVIARNDCERLGEVALYAEFAFSGIVIADNLVRQASSGVSVTNLDHGGRLASVRGNVIRDLSPKPGTSDVQGYGILAEAETAVSGNVVEGAPTAGLWLGWGSALRNVAAHGNVIRRCGVGIAISFADGAGEAAISGNVIAKSRAGAIIGFDHFRPVTGDLTKRKTKIPSRLIISGNRV